MELSRLGELLRPVVDGLPADVLAVYLYGSRAREAARADSDVDLGVLLAGRPASRLSDPARALEAVAEKALGIPTEAVILNRASPDLVHRVLRDGIILLDRDRSARIRFEVQARNEYFDLEPLRRLYRRVPM